MLGLACRQVSLRAVDGATLLKLSAGDPVVDGRLTAKVFYTGGWLGFRV